MTGDAATRSGDANWRLARELVLRFGWNSAAYQILNPGFRLWFDDSREAVVGYVEAAGMVVAAGAPVCAPERLDEVAAAFERHARGTIGPVCWFAAEARLAQMLSRDHGRALVRLGAQPVWDPQEWQALTHRHSSVRAQLNRARNKGVEVNEWRAARERVEPPDSRGRADPPENSGRSVPPGDTGRAGPRGDIGRTLGDIGRAGPPGGVERSVPSSNRELHEALREWLATHGLPPLQFLVQTNTLDNLIDRRLFVARRQEQLVGFVVASPVPARDGWLLEQVVRRPAAPNGTAELMIDAAALELAESGASYLTLGLAPLAQPGGSAVPGEPLWLSTLLRCARAHGRRFYNFEGLEYFKSKFRPPRWDPLYLVEPGPRPSPRTLYAVGDAFSPGSPVTMLGKALFSAARQELGAAIAGRRQTG